MNREKILSLLRAKYPNAVRITWDGHFYHVTGSDRHGEYGIVRADTRQVKNLLGL